MKRNREGRIVPEVHRLGYGICKSRRLVKAVFDCMIRALKRGEVVEIPGGRLTLVPNPRPKRKQVCRVTGKLKIGTFDRYRKLIKFLPDESVCLTDEEQTDDNPDLSPFRMPVSAETISQLLLKWRH